MTCNKNYLNFSQDAIYDSKSGFNLDIKKINKNITSLFCRYENDTREIRLASINSKYKELQCNKYERNE